MAIQDGTSYSCPSYHRVHLHQSTSHSLPHNTSTVFEQLILETHVGHNYMGHTETRLTNTELELNPLMEKN